MALGSQNAVPAGSVQLVECSPCEVCEDCATVACVDAVYSALQTAGASAADLARYQALGQGDYMCLTGFNTIAKVQALRNAFLSNVPSGYRIGNTDANFDAASSGGGANQIVTPSLGSDNRLQANTAVSILFVGCTANVTEPVLYEMRLGTSAYSSGSMLGVTMGPMGSKGFVVSSDPSLTGASYQVYVVKQPTAPATVDLNTAIYSTQGSTISYGGTGNNAIGSTRTAFTTNNTINRQWQALAAQPAQLVCSDGGITAMTVNSVSSIFDGGANQTVTFNVTATAGTVGAVDFTGSTVTGADITQVSLNTASTYVGAFPKTFTIAFTINAADIPALVAPNTQNQSYSLTVSANGTPIVLSATGTRVTDAIVSSLTGADLTAYNAATTGQVIEISAAGYNALASGVSGAGKYGATDATMALCTGNWGGGAYNAAVGGGSSGSYSAAFIPANNYPFAFSTMMNGVGTTVIAGNAEFGYYGASAGAGATTWTPKVLMGTNSSQFVSSAGRRYFVVKNANSKTTQQSAVMSGGVNGFIGGVSAGAALNFVKTVTPTSSNSVTNNYSWMLGIQCLATPTKQW